MSTPSVRRLPRIGSGTVIAFGAVVTLTLLICLGQLVGWDATWRSIGVTPLQPHFFDMHVVLDYAVCAAKGFDAYIPHSCNQANFNIPPIWLYLGHFGINGSHSTWLSAAIIAAALAVMIALFKGRSAIDGAVALAAILSPSVMMGVERGNLDLLILALVGAAALTYQEQRVRRTLWSAAIISLAIVLKLFPMFCIAVGARFSRRTLLFVAFIAVFSLVYLADISHYVVLIRRNVPTTFMLSYGYKAAFLGLDHLRAEAGLSALALADTWIPIALAIVILISAAATALVNFQRGRLFCEVSNSAAGTAFLFGSGIYCGTFLLSTNFIYRLMFLLLCLPQLQDWLAIKSNDRNRKIEAGLFVTILAALWLNGDANGHSTFLFVPQLVDWLLFFGLAAVLISNCLNGAIREAK